MGKGRIFTGVTVTEQMNRARAILENKVIPQEQLFQERKRKGELSERLIVALKENA